MTNNFTFKNYTELLRYFKTNHEYLTFSEYRKESNKNAIILLRHDIDFSLKHALIMAKLEADLGIKSTYFVLFSSPYYNVLDDENIQVVSQINELGHEIGLHYDVSVIEKGNEKDPLSLLKAKANILGNLIGSPVTSIAMHNPSIHQNDIFQNTDYINVDNFKFSNGIAYFSDSCMAWRNDFIEHLKLDNFPPKIQLLIHPFLWSEKVLNRWEALEEFKLIKTRSLEQIVENNKQLWKSHSGVIEHDKRVSREADH